MAPPPHGTREVRRHRLDSARDRGGHPAARAVHQHAAERGPGAVQGVGARDRVVAGDPAGDAGRLHAGVLGDLHRRALRPLPGLPADRADGLGLLRRGARGGRRQPGRQRQPGQEGGLRAVDRPPRDHHEPPGDLRGDAGRAGAGEPRAPARHAPDDDPAAGPRGLPDRDDGRDGARAGGAERLLPRRPAHPDRPAAALVLPDADLLLARPAPGQRVRERLGDRGAALREPADAAGRGGARRRVLRRLALGRRAGLRRASPRSSSRSSASSRSGAWSPRWRWSSERPRAARRGPGEGGVAALPDLPRAQRHPEGGPDARAAGPLHRAVGPARRERGRRARRGARHRRRERLRQEHPAQAAGRDHPPARGAGGGRRPDRLDAGAGRGLPPRLHRAGERLHERRHPGALAPRGRRADGGDHRLLGAGGLHRQPRADLLVGHVHPPRLRRGLARRLGRAPAGRGAGRRRRGLPAQVPGADLRVPPRRRAPWCSSRTTPRRWNGSATAPSCSSTAS